MVKGGYFLAVLLVSLATPAWAVRYVDNGDGTVTDTQTKLVWQKSIQADPAASPEPWKQQSWEDAVAYCENLTLAGHGNWRLPNYRALQSLLDDTKSTPPVMDPLFVGGWLMEYWSSTSNELVPTQAWTLKFEYGSSQTFPKGSSYPYFYARCVTGGL